MTKSTPNERLKRARERANIGTMRDACSRYGWSYETYKKHEGTRPIDPELVVDYARAYGVDPGWILWGINPPSWDEATSTFRLRGHFRSVPKLTPEQAVHIPEMFSKYQKSTPETPVDHGPDIGPRAFSFDISDEAMLADGNERDSFGVGDIVIFDPDRTPRPGDFVLAHVEGEGQAIFRKYRMRGMEKGKPIYELSALNSNYGAVPIGPNGQKARVIGLMIRHIRKYGTSS